MRKIIYKDLPLNQVKTLILSMGGDKTLDIKHIQQYFEAFLYRKVIPMMTIGHEFLIRCSDNEPGEVFNHVSRCSYHPKPDKIPLQRCNYKEQQVFYAAVPARGDNVSGDMTALLECTLHHAKNKNIRRTYMTLSRWKLNRPLRVFVLPFVKRSVRNNPDFKEINKQFNIVLKRECGKDKILYRYLKEFLSFMSNLFCKRGNRLLYYRISAAFYNAAMAVSKKYKMAAEGLIYPSANSKAEGMNIVLQKEIVDRKVITCDLVVMYVMERHPSNPKDVTYYNVTHGEIPSGTGRFAFAHIW